MKKIFSIPFVLMNTSVWVKTILIIFCISFSANFLHGQESVSITSTTNKVEVSEPFEVKIKIIISDKDAFEGIDFGPFDEAENSIYKNDTTYFERFADLNILEAGSWNNFDGTKLLHKNQIPMLSNGTNFIIENTLTLAIYNEGKFSIPVPEIKGFSQSALLKSPSLDIEVFVAQKDTLSTEEIYPIKPIMVEPELWTDYLVYILILLGLIALWFLYKYYRKIKKVDIPFEPEIIVEKIPPYQRALEALSDLEAKELWQKGEIKAFQTELTFIVREYIENQFNINALEMTSQELVNNLRTNNILNAQTIIVLQRILNIADLVKFAKAIPDQNLNQQFLDEAKELIIQTKNKT